MCVLRINRHAPNPITAPPSTITPMMIATTTRMAFSAPPPWAGVAAGAAATAGFAAAPAGPAAAVVWKPEAPVIVAPQLVQNFPAPSSDAPHDVQNAMTHLSNHFSRSISQPLPGAKGATGVDFRPLHAASGWRIPREEDLMSVVWPVIFAFRC